MSSKKKDVLIRTAFFLFPLVVLFVLGSLGSCSSYEYKKEIKKSFSVKKNQTLTLKSDFGSVTVDSWNRNEIRVKIIEKVRTSRRRKAEKLFDRFTATFDQNSQGLEIRGEYHGSRSWLSLGAELRVHYEIIVPYNFNLYVQTSSGEIDVTDLAGEVRLTTSGGSVSLGEILGRVFVRTSGGGISLKKVAGDVDVKTSGGGIKIGKVTGALKAITSGGGVSTKMVKGDAYVRSSGGGLSLYGISGRIQGETSGGSVKAEIIGHIAGNSYLKTSGGSITVYINENANFNIDAYTSGGSVSLDLPVKVIGKIKSNAIVGKVNRGGSMLKLRTSGGSIRIKPLIK